MILKNISNPDDLKKISKEYLPEVCESIRELIIDTCSKCGGHLASSLGVVELTVALHYVFNSPDDKIVWDVGHQAYAHKILTGRRKSFGTLRTTGGISGFPKMEESPHDVFGTGHASTSISAALGIAKALKKKGSNNKAIAVIGDGSMTGGLALEALNLAGHKVGNLIIILNDNEMSISENVGALSKFLSIHLHGKTVNRFKRYLKKTLLLIPVLGKRIYKFFEKAEEATIGFFTPGHLFEAFGCDYIGPLDGHNITEMTDVFERIINSPSMGKPILIHVMTKKGRGYKYAEDNPTIYHGVGPFCREKGVASSSEKITYTQAFSEAMLDLAGVDDRVVAITAAMPSGTGLEAFAKKYPDRFYDIGIAEGHAVTFAAGLATQGYRPVVAIYSTFMQRAYDHIIHDVCLQKLPVTFALDRAGIVGEDGPTHHGIFDISYLRSIPDMILMAPRDDVTLKEMLSFAVTHNGPAAIRYPRGCVPKKVAKDKADKLQIGQAEIVYETSEPKAIILSIGNLVESAVEASEMLIEKGVGVIVVDPKFIKPFDFNLLEELIGKCPIVITVEENVLSGGFGSMIGEWMANNSMYDVQLKCLGITDEFPTHGTQKYLRELYQLDAVGIKNAVVEVVNRPARSL